MLLPDVNILVHAFRSDTSDHERCRRWLEAATRGRPPLGMSPQVLAGFPFQLNFVIPPGTPTGSQTVQITSPYGSSTQTIDIRAVSPAIFLLATGGPAVLNQNGSLNSPDSPATRGQALTVYATGLGSVERRGSLDRRASTGDAAWRRVSISFAG